MVDEQLEDGGRLAGKLYRLRRKRDALDEKNAALHAEVAKLKTLLDSANARMRAAEAVAAGRCPASCPWCLRKLAEGEDTADLGGGDAAGLECDGVQEVPGAGR